MPKPSIIHSLDALLAKTTPRGDCLVWLGARGSTGYGAITIQKNGKRKWFGVHRIVWMLYNNTELGDLCVLHSCDNPPCINPAHLFSGTTKDNALDKIKKGRANMPKGESHWRAKLTSSDILEIRKLYSSGKLTQGIIGDKYGVTQSEISRIVTKDAWRQLELENRGTR